MICVCIGQTTYDECLRRLESLEFAEIRLDLTDFSIPQIGKIFSLPVTLIATCRPGRIPMEQRREILTQAVQAGACYVDVDLDESLSFRESIRSEAEKHGCRLIISYHNFQRTPTRKSLEKTIHDCFDAGADIVKVACQVQSSGDCARILSLYDRNDDRRGAILAIGMGKKGSWTRVVAPFLGAPFTFAAPDQGPGTAGGQLKRESLEKIYQALRREMA